MNEKSSYSPLLVIFKHKNSRYLSMKIKIISMIVILTLLLSSAAMGLISASAAEPTRPEDWTTEGDVNDHDFAFAFVGDIQSMTAVDYKNSLDDDPENDTAYVDTLFSWLANNAESQKIKHVFTLGDLTEYSSENDPDLSYAAREEGGSPNASGDKEWTIVKSAISKLDGIVPYSIVRGNHDDYQIDTVFGYDAYKSNFNGFYAGEYALSNQADREAKYYTNSITNSYKLVEIEGIKYIFITLDFNPTRGVVTWLDNILTQYSDYNAIITTHSFIREDLSLATAQHLQTVVVAGKAGGAAPEWIWKNCLSKHSNVMMTVCGHWDAQNVRMTTTEGDNGNQVLHLMVNPQVYDKRVEASGLVFLMRFFDGGKTVKAEYYSTILDLYKTGNSYEWSYSDDRQWTLKVADATTEASEQTAQTTTEATEELTTLDATTAGETTTYVEATNTQTNGCKSSLSLSAVALLPAFATLSAISMKKKKR